MSEGVVNVGAAVLTDWAIACLHRFELPEHDACCLAESLVQTSLWGIDSHGIARLTHYLNRLTHGSIQARPDIVVTRSGQRRVGCQVRVVRAAPAPPSTVTASSASASRHTHNSSFVATSAIARTRAVPMSRFCAGGTPAKSSGSRTKAKSRS